MLHIELTTLGWVTMTEPYSARLRVRQTTITMLVYWTSTWAVGFVTPYLVDETAANLGVNVSYIWFGMVVLSLLWAFLCVPELSGLSISEVSLLPFVLCPDTEEKQNRWC